MCQGVIPLLQKQSVISLPRFSDRNGNNYAHFGEALQDPGKQRRVTHQELVLMPCTAPLHSLSVEGLLLLATLQ